MPDPSPDDATRPKLVSMSDRGVRPADPPRSKRAFAGRLVGRIGWAVFALLFLLAIGALSIQTRRVETLSGEVDGLQLELGGARRQLGVYQAKLDFVRDSLSGVLDELTLLHELVNAEDPLPPAEEEPPNAD